MKRLAAATLSALLLSAPALAQDDPSFEELRAGFQSPPDETKPWTWFHVMSGNMSRAGLTKDIEALADAGVGGIVLFHVTQGISTGTVRFASPEHMDLIAHAAAECERVGIKFAFHNADGWSSTGGPWITPEQSMKRVVHTERLVTSTGNGQAFELAQPQTREGFYRDIAVLAYPALEAERADAARRPVLTASDPQVDFAAIMDGDATTMTRMEVLEGGKGWFRFDYPEPVPIRSVRIDNTPSRHLVATLEVSDDGETWREVHAFDKPRVGKYEWSVDSTFAPVTARHFRVTASETFELGELALSSLARIPNAAGHTTLAYIFGAELPATLDVPDDAVIDPAKLVDLSNYMAEDGTVTATLPAGEWTVMRFGYTSTGARNVNGSPEGTGLEVDKFDAAAFQAHYDAFIGPVIERARAVAPTATAGVMIDSYEVGGQTWTQGYGAMFEERHGHSILPWLPAFAGRVVSSGLETRAMLAKIRAFNEVLVRDNYYQAFADLMERDGLESLIQPYGNGPSNEVDVGAIASIPSGEFWMGRPVTNVNHSVSAARLYDKEVVAAEAFTAEPQINWSFSPALGKKWGDRAWAMGINQFLFHRFAHQANTHVMPGMTMNRWGSHFDRTQPWWDDAGKAWFEYMARGQYLLRQGHGVADVALFVGEDAPVECPEKIDLQDRLPRGVEYDCLNSETLFDRSRFVDGALELPHGARYRMIWWAQDRPPSREAFDRLEEARRAGVPVAYAHAGHDAAQVFERAGLAPRIASDGPLPLFAHRKLDSGADVFFLLNFSERDISYDLDFGFAGRAVELWNPVTGEVSPLARSPREAGSTRISLALLAGQSAFVAFAREGMASPALATSASPTGAALTLSGPWQIAFDPAYGDAGTIDTSALFDWRLSDDPEVRNFSGKATYTTSFEVARDWLESGRKVLLDIGEVHEAAAVSVNGTEVGTAWTAPFTLDVTNAVRAGKNDLAVRVANLWTNRLIGDEALPDQSGYEPEGRIPERDMVAWYSRNESLPEGPRRTFTTQTFYSADDPLVPSGLIGPVRLVQADSVAWVYAPLADDRSYTQPAIADLKRARQAAENGNAYFAGKMAEAVRKADAALAFEPEPVTAKPLTAPSGDKHDYLSLAPYWWPDESEPDGLPWIRRDGEINPLTRGANTDYDRYKDAAGALSDLGLGYLVSDNPAYAEKIAAILRVWFIDPATRVNPNLNYAQGIPGINGGREFGIIEWTDTPEIITAAEIATRTGAFSADEARAVETWFVDYLDWLRNSELGKRESTRKNNHGSWYDVQVLSLMRHLAMTEVARDYARETAMPRIASQIAPNGSQPHENDRTKSLHYNAMNLIALTRTAVLARQFGVDISGFTGPEGQSLIAAHRHLVPYALREKTWTHEQITPGGVEAAIDERLRPMLVIDGAMLGQPFLSDAEIRAIAPDLSAEQALLYPPRTLLEDDL